MNDHVLVFDILSTVGDLLIIASSSWQWPWLGQVEVPRPIVVEKCIEVPKIQAQGLSFGKGASTSSLPLEDAVRRKSCTVSTHQQGFYMFLPCEKGPKMGEILSSSIDNQFLNESSM